MIAVPLAALSGIASTPHLAVLAVLSMLAGDEVMTSETRPPGTPNPPRLDLIVGTRPQRPVALSSRMGR